MAETITCFVSFSSVDTLEGDIKFLIEFIVKKTGQKIKFKIYFNEKSGTDLQNYMIKELQDADAVLMLLTPDYKQKVDQQKKSGVLTEHKIIADRLENKNLDTFIPVYWRGSAITDVIPEFYFNHESALDLHKFSVLENKQRGPYIADRTELETAADIAKLVAQLEQSWLESSKEFEEATRRVESTLLKKDDFDTDRLLDRAMFTKQERASYDIEYFSNKIFTKTSAYRNIDRYQKSAFTGRKGAGKTTLLKVYKFRNASHYFQPIDVEVNDWDLHDILGDLTFRKPEGDLSYTAQESKIFDFIWPVFLSFAMVRSIQETNLPATVPLIKNREFSNRFEDAKNRYAKIFLLSVEFVRAFFQTSIDAAPSSTEEQFKLFLTEKLNVRNCTEMLLGENYSEVQFAIKSDINNRKILFCLDRFDTEIQKYRKDLADRKLDEDTRRDWELREIQWILSLVEMIDHLRSPDYFSLNQEFYKTFGPIVDFCVPLPRDRLIEVQRRRRDSIVGASHEEICWSPAELLTMLRKRLQIVWEIEEVKIDKAKFHTARKRFDQLQILANRNLPKIVEMELGSRKYPIDIFLYALRHSFFRPRDILIYFSGVIASLEAARRRHSELTSHAIKAIISKLTFRVVKEEFIGEFTDTIKNLDEVMQKFRFSQQIIDFSFLSSQLESVNFALYGGDYETRLAVKIRILYEIGFIGICSQNGQIGGVPSDTFQYFFFAPMLVDAVDNLEVAQQLSYAIHPAFVEYLNLRTGPHPPVMYFNWESIENDDQHQ
jgi:TIR domain